VLRLHEFTLERPETVEDAVATFHASPRPRYLAAGTDLLPNLKQGLDRPETLISLRHIAELRQVQGGESLTIGAGMTLAQVVGDRAIQEVVPALVVAAGGVATPQIRNMATLGGNVCLDTRCRYVNQSALFREALGGCLKSHGTLCHVVPGGRKCVAAMSADTVPPLIAHGASVTLAGLGGRRVVPLTSFFGTDGLAHTHREHDEILVSIQIPKPAMGTVVGYRKWAVRKSFDFPLVSVAVRLETDARRLQGGAVVVGALGPKPRVIALKRFKDRPLGDELAADIGALGVERARPLPNIPYDPDYRRRRLGVALRRMCQALMEGAGAGAGGLP
jgi:4-hydroxybenzoyl-CoA reductase subunit beta